MNQKDMLAQIAALQAENAALKTQGIKRLSFKVSKSGGMSVYGLGRWPTTLYKEQWLRLLDIADELRTFLNNSANVFTNKANPNAHALAARAKQSREAKALQEMNAEDLTAKLRDGTRTHTLVASDDEVSPEEYARIISQLQAAQD